MALPLAEESGECSTGRMPGPAQRRRRGRTLPFPQGAPDAYIIYTATQLQQASSLS